MGGDFRLFSWTIARIKSGSWWSKDELNLWRRLSLVILSWNTLRMTSDRNCSAKHRYGQSSWSKNGAELSIILSWIFVILHFVSGSHLILQRNMSFFVSLLLWNHEMFLSNGILTKYLDQTPTCKIKDNQSWRLKVFWLQKWLDAWKWHEVTKQFWTHTFWNWTTSCS
jgi:hypothetical protein